MKRTLITTARFGLAGLALAALAACSDNSGSRSASNAAPPPPPQPAPTAPVAQATIRDVQNALQSAGYYKNGSVDGIWGRGTQVAVTRFQHDKNLAASGKLDVPTMQALNLAGAPPSTDRTVNPPATPNTAPSNTGPAPTDNTAPVNPPASNDQTTQPAPR